MRKNAVITPLGMNRDLAMSKFDARFTFENRNLRLITDETTSKFVMTNEKGPERIDIWFYNNRTSQWQVGDIYGLTIGVANIGAHLVLFTHGTFRSVDPVTHEIVEVPRDRIYRIDFEDDAIDGMPVKGYQLYVGDLGFSPEHPIETLPFYELEEIQKVYWTDGINQPRMINIMADNTNYNDTSFDFAQLISGHETIAVTRIDDTNGMFPSGTVQYAMTYYNRYGQESNIACVSPMMFSADNDRGGAPDEIISCSFSISLGGLKKDYDGVRIYSIIRTSKDSMPVVKRVADLSITIPQVYTSQGMVDAVYGTASYIDNNTTGEDVESTYLLYVGAKAITCETITQKDNTAFYGNITELRGTVSDDLREGLKDNFSNLGFANEKTITMPSTLGKYNWNCQLDKSAEDIRFFKHREIYRFGVQLQDKYGNWSDVIRLENTSALNSTDFYQGLKPESDTETKIESGEDVFGDTYTDIKRKCAIFKGTLDVSSISSLLDDYIAIRPVVVYPELSDRNIVAQGILTPTVYNLDDRVNSGIYGQMSWFSRPLVSSSELNMGSISNIKQANQITDHKVLEVRHYQPLPPVNRYVDNSETGKWYFGSNAELVNNFESNKVKSDVTPPVVYKTIDYTFWANVHPFQEKINGSTYDVAKDVRARQLRSQFFIDQSVETFHSPEVEYTDAFANMDMDGLRMRIVGIVPITYHNEGVYLAAEEVTASTYFHYPDRDIQEGGTTYIYGPTHAAFKQFTEFGGAQATFERVEFESTVQRSITMGTHGINVGVNDTVTASYWGTNKLYPWHTKTATMKPTDVYPDDDSIADMQYGGEPMTSDFVGTPLSTISKKIYDSIHFSYDTLYFDQAKGVDIDTPSYFNTVDGGMVSLDVDGDKKVFDFNVSKSIVASNRKFAYDRLEYSNGFILPGNGDLSISLSNPLRQGNHKGTSCIFSSEAVPMNYRGTSSLVMHLSSDMSGSKRLSTALPMYIACQNTYNNVFDVTGTPRESSTQIQWRSGSVSALTSRSKVLTSSETFLWDERYGGMTQDTITYPFGSSDLTLANGYGFFYLAELYRTNVQARFGGDSEEAVAANTWLPCGDAVPLRDDDGNLLSSVEVKWTRGDTYYQRYDNLHTYPYTEEDTNQIVDIVSFMCETHVNIDGRYDEFRGIENNENTRPTNTNRLNGVYGQNPNYFSYRAVDHNRIIQDAYPITVAWSKTKKPGEWNDVWTNVTLANTLDMDGAKGAVRALRRHFDDILAFQDTGVSRILFNEQQALQTEAGVPLEIANSGKVTGRYYISPNLGCHNKWSICSSPQGTYFFDDAHRDILFVNSERQIKSVGVDKGFRSWSQETADMAHTWDVLYWRNIRSLYDKRNGEMMFVTDDDALDYNEQLAQFTSFYDYGRTPFLESVQNHNVMVRNEGGFGILEDLQPRTYLFEHNAGEYNNFFGTYKPFWTEMLCHSDGTDKDSSLLDKTWTNVSFQFDTFDDSQLTPSARYKEDERFDRVDCQTEYQQGSTAWINDYPGIAKKFRMWHADLPRDGYTVNADGGKADRLRNPWLRMRLTKNSNLNNNYRSVLHSVTIGYLE